MFGMAGEIVKTIKCLGQMLKEGIPLDVRCRSTVLKLADFHRFNSQALKQMLEELQKLRSSQVPLSEFDLRTFETTLLQHLKQLEASNSSSSPGKNHHGTNATPSLEPKDRLR